MTVSAERLREVVAYDPETGEFTRRVRTSNRVRAGGTVGVDGSHGYRYFTVDGLRRGSHRWAWLYMTGEWPEHIDHIDGDRANNRFANLRSVPPSWNLQHKLRANRDSRSGVLGVSWSSHKRRWAAAISVDGKTQSLGRYRTIAEAEAAYLEAKRRLHPGFLPRSDPALATPDTSRA